MRRVNLAKCAIIDLPIEKAIFYDDNPRLHPERQITMIEASIRKFDMVNPILVTPNNEIIAGHGRVIAARRLGMKSIPAIMLPHLSEAEVKAFRVADNAIALKGEWSIELLAQEIELVASLDLDFDPIEIGMETGEIDFLISSTKQKATTQLPPALVAEPDRSTPAIARIGDVFTIGRHIIVCGNSIDPKVYHSAMGSRLADAVISDMPWNLPAKAISGLGAIKHRDFLMAAGEMSAPEFAAFTETVLSNQAMFAKPGALCFQFINWRSVDVVIAGGKKNVGDLVNICVWVKPSGGMGSLWRSRHELVCVFRVQGGKSKNNVELGKHGRNRSNVWEYASPSGFGPERQKLKLHPTCKNEKMIGDAIMDCTDRNDLILDAFLGSGTTILAAHETGRIGVGIELDPYYVDLAVGRISVATGETAIHTDGRSFDQLRAERSAGEEA